jgi:hypothetical protein
MFQFHHDLSLAVFSNLCLTIYFFHTKELIFCSGQKEISKNFAESCLIICAYSIRALHVKSLKKTETKTHLDELNRNFTFLNLNT